MRAHTSIRHIYFYYVCVYTTTHHGHLSEKGGTRATTNCCFFLKKRRSTCVSYAYKHFDIAFCAIKYMEYEQSEIPTLGQTDIVAAAERERKHTGEKRLQRQSYNANINEIHDLCCICESMHSLLHTNVKSCHHYHPTFSVETKNGYKVDKIKRFKNSS